MRNGYKVYDTDPHIEPSADTLEKMRKVFWDNAVKAFGEP